MRCNEADSAGSSRFRTWQRVLPNRLARGVWAALLCFAWVSAPLSAQAQSGVEEGLEELGPVEGGSGIDELEPASGGAVEIRDLPAGDAERPAPTSSGGDVVEMSPEFHLRLQELEDRVNDLKEEIFRSKSRLVLLRERILRSAIGGSQALIRHVNDMSATFALHQVIYSLDGHQIFASTDEQGDLSDRDSIEIYNGAILPGPHNISVEMVFIGSGFGVFSYVEGYRFRVRSSYAFTAEDGRVANLDVVAYEQGGVNQPIEERPDIRYELEFTDAIAPEEE